jgi:hypothetical protein
LHHAPQRTNSTHPTAARSGSPDPETPDAPGVSVLTAEAVAHCGYLAPLVQVKKQIPFGCLFLLLAKGCWLLHQRVDSIGAVGCHIHLSMMNYLLLTCEYE